MSTYSNPKSDVILSLSFTVFDSDLIQTLILFLCSFDDDDGAIGMNIFLFHKTNSWGLTNNLWKNGSHTQIHIQCWYEKLNENAVTVVCIQGYLTS